jgi:hypothetical protein
MFLAVMNCEKKFDFMPGLLANGPPPSRGATRRQAAALHDLSLSGFDKARREGKIPGPTLPGRRYDLQLLHANMNRLSGISTTGNGGLSSPLEHWRARHAR